MRKEQNFKWNKIGLGVCYYPEQWDKALWREDLRRMKAVGIGTVRVAEFTWSIVEPMDGEFNFGVWDGFFDVAQEEGLKV
ncbi:MAG: beta-galactosidase, partial [Clostridiales bacterium]|nr:beta-galactosidase [Clostridiales bacterium]